MSQEPETKVKASVELDITAGKVGASTEVSGIPAIVNAFRSPKAKIQHATAERIANHMRSGKQLEELTQFEQSLLMDASADTIVKAMNKAEVVKRALARDPDIAGLLAAGPSEAQEVSQVSTEKADEQQRFWERFWTDAENTSVEYVQEIYARILAGQARKPASFSLSALEVLRCIDNATASLFNSVVPFVLGPSGIIPNVFAIRADGPTVSHLIMLTDANLLSSTTGTAKQNCTYEYGPWVFRLGHGGQIITPSLFPLTKAGRELSAITGVKITEEYALHAVWICTALSAKGHPCEVAFAIDGPWTDWKVFFKEAIAEQARVDAEAAASKVHA